MDELTFSPIWPEGTAVMLSDAAPESIVLMIGSEAVLTILWPSGGAFEDSHFYRRYLCRHEHRGRLTFDHVPGGSIDERFLRVISKEEAIGQKMLYNAQAEVGGIALATLMEREREI